jgi:hypothetical protein
MLTELQLELVKTFSRPLPEDQVLEIRQLLADYFARKVDEEVDRVMEERGYDERTIDEWLNTHMRTPYQR